MHIRNKFIAVTVALLCLLSVPAIGLAAPAEATLSQKSTSLSGTVRVYLSSLSGVTTLSLTIDGNYSLNGSQALSRGSSAQVSYEGGRLYLTLSGTRKDMGTSFTLRRLDTSGNNGIKIAQAKSPSNWYNGDMEFAVRNGRLYPIVYVNLENYLLGVLPYEMANSWPLEALKAQAVAARTYAVNAMNKRAAYYDVVDTTTDQVYRGMSGSTDRCYQAVQATQGVVAMSGGSYISANYTASNGGQTESPKNAWGSSGHSYLDVHEDPYDLANPSSRKVSSSFSTTGSLGALLQQKVAAQRGGDASIRSITDVSVQSPKYASPSRLYTEVKVTMTLSNGSSTSVVLNYFNELEGMMGLSINSTANELISVERSGSTFVLAARRYGHGIGMSQRGAEYMANQGMNYKQIIGFYYPGASLVQHSFSGTTLPPLSGDTGVDTTPVPQTPTDPAQGIGLVSLSNPADWLNLRSGEGTDTAVLAQLRHGQALEVISSNGTWCKVRYGSLEGYVMQCYLVFVELEGTPVPETTPDPDGTAAPEETTGSDAIYRVAVALNDPTSRLNLRSGPDTSSSIVLRLMHGTVLEVTGESGGWLAVRYGTASGYVLGSYVTRLADEPTDAPEEPGETPETTPAPEDATEEPGETPAPEDTPEEPGETPEATPAPDDTDSPADSGIYQATVNVPLGQTVNLRSEPSTASAVMRTLSSGTLVTYTEATFGWRRVTYDVWQGYVMSNFLTPIGAVPTETPLPDGATPEPAEVPDARPPLVQTATVALQYSSSKLNLRASASASGKVIATISSGAEVQVITYGYDWCEVEYRKLRGYAATPYLDFGEVYQQMSAEVETPIVIELPQVTPGPLTNTDDVGEDGEEGEDISAITAEPEAPVADSLDTDNAPTDATEQPFEVYVSVANTLNLRAEPSTSARILSTLRNGASLSAVACEDGWYKVQWQDGYAYASATYIVREQAPTRSTTPSKVGTAPEKGPTPVAETGETPEDFQEDYQEDYENDFQNDDREDYQPAPQAEQWEPDPEPQRVAPPEVRSRDIINEGTAREEGTMVRRRPDSDSDNAGSLPKRASVLVLGYEGSWCSIAYEDLRGYVRRSELQLNYPVAEVSGVAMVYAEPNPDAAEVITLQGGSVSVCEMLGEWAEVRLPGGKQGYTPLSALRLE